MRRSDKSAKFFLFFPSKKSISKYLNTHSLIMTAFKISGEGKRALLTSTVKVLNKQVC